MPKARISKEQHDLLVEAFRERPGVALHAAARAGVTYRTAKRAWDPGWPDPGWATPIRQLFEDEERSARAILASEQALQAKESAQIREERALARFDAARERAREAEGVRAALSNSLSLMANLAAFSRASIELSQKAAGQLLDEVAKGQVPWREAVLFLTKLSLVGERATSQLKETMTAIRLHLGEPEKFVGIVAGSGPTTDVDGRSAVQVLGEDRVRQAVIDIASGRMTEDAERLMAWQVEQPPRQLPARAGEGNA